MARITVVIFFLSSVFGIDAGKGDATQVYNVTRLEKRIPAMTIEEANCALATYKTDSLYDFVYKYKCYPAQWEKFFIRKKVEEVILEISRLIEEDAEEYEIQPPMPDILSAFENIGLDDVKVVILGQDPTPQPNKATGMAFSLEPGEDPRTVPSVLNILVELKWEEIDVGLSNGDLTLWRDQGVLLLNSALTIPRGKGAESHLDQGVWQYFTEYLLNYISYNGPSSVWILLGEKAQTFTQHIKKSRHKVPPHYIKVGGHPSPQGAAGFFGGNYFLCANNFLTVIKRGPIDWKLPPPENEIEAITKHAKC